MLSQAHFELLAFATAVGFDVVALLQELLPIFAVVTAFALIARWMRAVTTSGALAGWLCAFALTFGGGFAMFAPLVAVFSTVSTATDFGHARKARLGLAEPRHGRSGGQVFANLAIAAICAIVGELGGGFGVAWHMATVAALAEAAADTVSSEIGQALSARPRLITTFARVPAGTDGAVSWSGSLAGLLAAAIVATTAMAAGLISLEAAGVAAGAGISGMLFDSLLGATLQRRGVIGNNLVNLLSTAFAAGVAILAILSGIAPV